MDIGDNSAVEVGQIGPRAVQESSPTSPSGFWESGLAPFLEKYCLLLCVC